MWVCLSPTHVPFSCTGVSRYHHPTALWKRKKSEHIADIIIIDNCIPRHLTPFPPQRVLHIRLRFSSPRELKWLGGRNLCVRVCVVRRHSHPTHIKTVKSCYNLKGRRGGIKPTATVCYKDIGGWGFFLLFLAGGLDTRECYKPIAG